MSESITGMNIYARDSKGKRVEVFKIKWFGQLAFGVIDENSTNRAFLELHSGEVDTLTKQRDDLKTACKDLLRWFDVHDSGEEHWPERERIEKQAKSAISAVKTGDVI